MVILRSIVLSVIIFWTYINDVSKGGIQVMTLNLERPVIEFMNSSFCRLINITSRRYSRDDSIYYLQIYGETYAPLDKYFTIHIRIDEYISYTIKRRFFDVDLSLCHFLTPVKSNILYKKSAEEEFNKLQFKDECGLPPGFYYFYNLTWPSASVPYSIPFKEGRMDVRLYSKDNATLCKGYIDLNLKSVSKARHTSIKV